MILAESYLVVSSRHMSYLGTRQWYVVYSKPHKEECAQFHLRLKGLEVFFPRLLLPKSSRKSRHIVPLFPNYLFVQMRILEEYHYVVWSPGVKKLVSFNGNPLPLEEEAVAFLMQQADPDGIIKARSYLKVGQEVEIIEGPFQGLIGIIHEPPNVKERVNVLLKLLNRQVKIELPVRFVKSGWVVEQPKICNENIGSNLV